MVGAGLAPALFYTPIMIFVGAGFTPALNDDNQNICRGRVYPCPVLYPIMIFVGAGFTPALLFTLPRCLPCPVVYPATFILFLIFLGQG
jgi:hypothetical protein